MVALDDFRQFPDISLPPHPRSYAVGYPLARGLPTSQHSHQVTTVLPGLRYFLGLTGQTPSEVVKFERVLIFSREEMYLLPLWRYRNPITPACHFPPRPSGNSYFSGPNNREETWEEKLGGFLEAERLHPSHLSPGSGGCYLAEGCSVCADRPQVRRFYRQIQHGAAQTAAVCATDASHWRMTARRLPEDTARRFYLMLRSLSAAKRGETKLRSQRTMDLNADTFKKIKSEAASDLCSHTSCVCLEREIEHVSP